MSWPMPASRAAASFVGGSPRTGGDRWAVVASLLATAQLNNLEPFAYLRDVLERMVDGHSASRLDELLPWNWKPAGALQSTVCTSGPNCQLGSSPSSRDR